MDRFARVSLVLLSRDVAVGFVGGSAACRHRGDGDGLVLCHIDDHNVWGEFSILASHELVQKICGQTCCCLILEAGLLAEIQSLMLYCGLARL